MLTWNACRNKRPSTLATISAIWITVNRTCLVEMSDKMNLDKCHDNCTCITFRCQKNDCIHGIQLKNWAFFCFKDICGYFPCAPFPRLETGKAVWVLSFDLSRIRINTAFRYSMSYGDRELIIATYPISQKLRGAPRLLFSNGCIWLDDIAEVIIFFFSLADAKFNFLQIGV